MADIDDFFEIKTLSSQRDYAALESGLGFILPSNGISTGAFHTGCCAQFIALLQFEMGKPRGHHYHNHRVENIIAVSGPMQCDLQLVDDMNQSKSIALSAGQVIRVQPRCIHTYTAIEKTIFAMEFSEQRFEQSDTIIVE